MPLSQTLRTAARDNRRVVLDIAAGPNTPVYRRLLKEGRSNRWRYVAVDLRNPKRVQGRAPIEHVPADARGKLPLPDAFAHVIYLVAPVFSPLAERGLPEERRPLIRLEAEQHPNARAFLAEIHRLLKPGGRAVLAIDPDALHDLAFLGDENRVRRAAKRLFEKVWARRFDRDRAEGPGEWVPTTARHDPFLRRLSDFPEHVRYLMVLKKASR